jgi:hypothetical protein
LNSVNNGFADMMRFPSETRLSMRAKKKHQLEVHGRHVGSVDEFLGLSGAETAYIERKLALSAQLKRCRQQ